MFFVPSIVPTGMASCMSHSLSPPPPSLSLSLSRSLSLSLSRSLARALSHSFCVCVCVCVAIYLLHGPLHGHLLVLNGHDDPSHALPELRSISLTNLWESSFSWVLFITLHHCPSTFGDVCTLVQDVEAKTAVKELDTDRDEALKHAADLQQQMDGILYSHETDSPYREVEVEAYTSMTLEQLRAYSHDMDTATKVCIGGEGVGDLFSLRKACSTHGCLAVL